MSSYTAQLFQSLQASAATQPTEASSGAAVAEEFNAVIEFQRGQISQLRARTAALEQQLNQVSAALARPLRAWGQSLASLIWWPPQAVP